MNSWLAECLLSATCWVLAGKPTGNPSRWTGRMLILIAFLIAFRAMSVGRGNELCPLGLRQGSNCFPSDRCSPDLTA